MRTLSGKTALVTGASAGIGREIARVLARDVATLVLVARRRSRLEALAAELGADESPGRPDLRVLVRDVDLADRVATGAMLDELERAGERIDVLVNNAGFGLRGLYDRTDWSRIEAMLELNVVSASFLISRLLPSMVQRGTGMILNVGSTSGVAPAPGSVAYGATKAYLNYMSEALHGELAGTGVTVTAVMPGPVQTEFQAVAGVDIRGDMPSVFYVDASTVAERAVRAMLRGRARVIPGAPVRAAALSLEVLPRALVRPVLSRMGRRIRRDAS